MNIDWANFTPMTALGGGALIGLAIAVLLLTHGRIAGISGVLNGLLHRKARDVSWRAAFVIGIIAAPLLAHLTLGLPEAHIDTGWPLLVVAGLLVGFGMRLGSGCTSGHGVCGLSRLSPRSMVATASFMFMGFFTVYVVRHFF
ncbi:MAG: YeeE/YedE family protein [Oxalobacter sp.]|nr:MAG: YeeE/YedE family protein [Oxalobacter sp.]